MVYFVTNSLELFESDSYSLLSVQESIDLINTWKVIQFDSETTGKDPRICDIVCIQFGNKAANAQIVVDTSTVNILLYKEILENIPMIGQNLKFDLKFLYKYNIIPKVVYDTMIVEQLLYLGYPHAGKPGGISFALNEIAYRYLNIRIDKSIRGDIIWRGLDTSVILYAAGDVTYLEDIMEAQLAECIKKDCLKGAKLECDFVPSIAYLEWCGIKLDVQAWTSKMNNDVDKLTILEEELNQYVINNHPELCEINLQGDLFLGFNSTPVCKINWASSKQVIEYFKILGFNTSVVDKKTGEDKDSVLEKHLKGQKGINDVFLKLYLDYKEADKVVSTYGQKYLNAINPLTDRIHTEFKQLGAASGRMSCGSKQINTDLAKFKKLPINVGSKNSNLTCSYPQLQNLPSDATTRSCFVPKEGNEMCSCDYSALESRLGADIYAEKSMIEEFLYGSGDIHSLVAKACFEELKDVPVKEIKNHYPKLRTRAKPIGFSQQFGGSAMAIAQALGCPLPEAEKIANAYNNGFPGIYNFKMQGSKFVRNNGYVLICEYTGHKLYWYDWEEWKEFQSKFNSDFWDIYRALKIEDPTNPLIQKVSTHFKAASKWDRMALNAPTQGTGIIILKYAITKFFRWIVDNNYFNIVLLCNLVHDEVVIEYPKGLEVDKVLKQYMEKSAELFCKSLPIPAEASTGNHWIH
jgi:DNA polymerase I-like protein with 3'-5' exonuclease and polymerase domains